MVDGSEKLTDVEFEGVNLASVVLAGLTQKNAQALDGGMSPLARATGVAVEDEAAVEQWFYGRNERLMDNAVADGGLVDFASLWVVDGEDLVAAVGIFARR